MAAATVCNGIDVGALVDTIEAIKARGASEQALKELCAYVQETSPVRDVANPVPVTTSIEVLR